MSSAHSSTLDRYLQRRRWWEFGLWLSLGFTSGLANSVVATIDLKGSSRSFEPAEPYIWEFSSVVVWLLLVRGIVWFERLFPIRLDTWRRALPWHLLATAVVSIIHVVGMVVLRQLVYESMGAHYVFGNWLYGLVYEYLKDIRTYALLLGIIYLYRLILLRLQGEARLFTAPDAGLPMEAIDRPERFLIRKVGAEFLVAANDIEWLEASENYVNFHVRGRAYPLRSTMTAIQERLDPERFVRVHRSYIVNLDFLAQIEPLETGDARLLLKDGTRIPCSRRYRSSLRGG
jgi:hypothetical protein